jgi:hypothetical protein
VTAEELLRRAVQVDVVERPGAKVRVWRGVEKRRARAAWRLAFPMFVLGAATTALLLLWMKPVPATVAAERQLQTGSRLPLLGEPARVELGAAGQLVTGANTVAQIDRFDERGVEISLSTGSVLVHVNPRTHGEVFLVRAPGFVARVVGTVFRVAAGPSGASLVVGHGTVELTRPGSPPQLLHAGERWPAHTLDLPDAAELAVLGDLEGARFEPPAPSESALYAAALQKQRAGDLRGALGAWREQHARFPQGVLRLEAQASIIDALVALHQDAEARAEVDAYLRDAPDGLRAAEMHFVRATLLEAADHDCRRAAAELDRALQRPAEPWASRARGARSACRLPR